MAQIQSEAVDKILLWAADHSIRAVPNFRFHPKRKWEFDIAFPDNLVACEVEGGIWVAGRHTRGAGYEKDMEKYSTAAMLGWAVIRCSPGQEESGVVYDWLERVCCERDIERLVVRHFLPPETLQILKGR